MSHKPQFIYCLLVIFLTHFGIAQGIYAKDYVPNDMTSNEIRSRGDSQKAPTDNKGYLVFHMSEQTPRNAALRSLLIPGWGQAFNGDKVKGGLIFTTVMGSVVGSILLNEKSEDTYDEYEAAGYINGSKYDDYKKERIQSMVLGGVAGVIWAFGIIEAYKSAGQYKYSKYGSFDVAFQSNEGRIHWSKKF